MEHVPVQFRLNITPVEKKLFEWLRAFQEELGERCPSRSELRVAGGWVRDKLMGMQSNDIDIALADCTGEAFANGFVEFLASVNNEVGSVSVHKVKANPGKSKHLATAKVDFRDLDLSVDFVNLRTESYTNATRIPAAEFGSPHEDAVRRDFTVNALFFNLSSGQIEDFTGHGLDHLRLRLLSTPLDSLQTFFDDPLRVLRAARFLGKLPGFKPDEELEKAASSDELKKPLWEKVSRDRFRQEVEKCFEAESPFRALLCFTRWKLWSCILAVGDFFDSAVTIAAGAPPVIPESSSEMGAMIHIESVEWRDRLFGTSRPALDYLTSGDAFRVGIGLCAVFEEVIQMVKSQKRFDIISEDCHWFWNEAGFRSFSGRGVVDISCMLIFYRGHKNSSKRNGSDSTDLASYALRNLGALQFSRQWLCFFKIFEAFLGAFGDHQEKAGLVSALTQPHSATYWELSLLLAAIVWEVPQFSDQHQWDDNESGSVASFTQLEERCRLLNLDGIIAQKVIAKVLSTKDLIMHRHNLSDIWNLRPIYDGKELRRMFPTIPSGPTVGKVLEIQRKWMVDHWVPLPPASSSSPTQEESARQRFQQDLTEYLACEVPKLLE